MCFAAAVAHKPHPAVPCPCRGYADRALSALRSALSSHASIESRVGRERNVRTSCWLCGGPSIPREVVMADGPNCLGWRVDGGVALQWCMFRRLPMTEAGWGGLQLSAPNTTWLVRPPRQLALPCSSRDDLANACSGMCAAAVDAEVRSRVSDTSVSQDPIGPRRCGCTFSSWVWLLRLSGGFSRNAVGRLRHSLRSLARSIAAAGPATSRCRRPNPIACMPSRAQKRVPFPCRENSFSHTHTRAAEHRSIKRNETRSQSRIQTESRELFSSRYNYWIIHSLSIHIQVVDALWTQIAGWKRDTLGRRWNRVRLDLRALATTPKFVRSGVRVSGERPAPVEAHGANTAGMEGVEVVVKVEVEAVAAAREAGSWSPFLSVWSAWDD